jgi:hypothetical protein
MQGDMPELLRGMYDGVSQLTPDGKTGGMVEMRFMEIPEGQRSYPAYVPDTLEQVLEWVEDCITDGYEPGDIAIICRANQKGIATAQFLIESGHSVVSSESLLINSSPYVRLMVNMAVFIIAPQDTTNQAELVPAPTAAVLAVRGHAAPSAGACQTAASHLFHGRGAGICPQGGQRPQRFP